MYYILYNPEIGGNKHKKKAKHLYNKYSKKNDTYMIDIKDINNQEETFISECKWDDTVFLCGGDGTIDLFVNKIKNAVVKCRIYVCPTGTGNDLARDFDGSVFEVTNLFKTSPTVSTNGGSPDFFVNGIGMGIDAVVCRVKSQYRFAGIKKSYFRIALEAMKSFRTYSLDITIDDVFYHFDNVWFFVVNQGRFMGGGMKVTPFAKRDDGLLDVCIVHDLSKIRLFMLFPLVYIGWHIFVKRHVFLKQGKSIQIKPDGCHSLQRDGEVFEGIVDVNVEANS